MKPPVPTLQTAIDWAERLREIGDSEDSEHAACIDNEEAYAAAAEIERLHGILLSIAAQSNGLRAIMLAYEALQTIRSPAVDHWMGRSATNVR